MALVSTINRPLSAAAPRPAAARPANVASAPSSAQSNNYDQQSQVDAAVKSGQHMMTGGEVGAGVSLAAGVGLAFAVNPLLGIGVGALGLLGSGAAFFLGLCKITAATD